MHCQTLNTFFSLEKEKNSPYTKRATVHAAGTEYVQ